MKAGTLAFASGLAALWLALFGLAALILGFAVVEVLCLEIAGVVLAVLSTGLVVLETRPCRSSGDAEGVPSYIDQAEADRLNRHLRSSIPVPPGDLR